MSFERLPVDIIRNIIGFTAPLIDISLSEWKAALNLLSVSAAWRTAGFSRMYRTAFIIDAYEFESTLPTHKLFPYDSDYGGVPAPTNIQLISQLGFERSVQRIVFHACMADNMISIIIRAINILAITEQQCLGVEALKEWSRERIFHNDVTPHLERECYAATVSIALQFVRLLPNVRVLRFKANLTHELQLTFMAELLYQYFDQLTDVDYTGLAHFPEPVACPRLSTLRIELRPHDDQHLPVIDPCALKFISLTLFEMPFRWSYLKSGSDTNPVSFDRLERFDVSLIKADALAPVRSHIEHARFPRLASLRIPNTAFGTTEALLLADSPLRKLTLIGLPEHTDERCWQSLSQLDTLELDMGYVGSDEFDDGFIARTNSLFSKTQGIDRVQATFQSSRVFSSPDLNWLYVTHLDIAVFNGLVDAFMAVARMPNLTEMVVTVMRINEGDIANVLPFLQSLRHRYVPLTAIKLETLRLKFWLYARNNVPTEDFQALWWYYPTLRNLEIVFQ